MRRVSLAAGGLGVVALVSIAIAQKAAESEIGLSPEEAALPAFIEFGEIVVNLDEGRLNRYLDVEIYLQVSVGEHDRIAELVAANKIPMHDWLLSYLSAQDQEDVRGPDNHNRLRTEIRDNFNALLVPKSQGGIDKVLFGKFVVQ